MAQSIAQKFDLRVLLDPAFAVLVNKFVALVKDSHRTGADQFWREVAKLPYSGRDVDECVFCLLMAGHYEEIADRGFQLFKSQEELILGKDYTIKNLPRKI